jgi:hypothetical protein
MATARSCIWCSNKVILVSVQAWPDTSHAGGDDKVEILVQTDSGQNLLRHVEGGTKSDSMEFKMSSLSACVYVYFSSI